ncbi:MAG: EAL domain-containing protein [Gammaproteobacteria bacterium]|nr:EAL domain-containing protein [Gammaproteobacteria bacterium]
MKAKEFNVHFTTLVAICWTLPPVIGFAFMLYIGLFTPGQTYAILSHPLEILFIAGTFVFAQIWFRIYVQPVARYLSQDNSAVADVDRILSRFPLQFWSLFLGSLALAPSSVIITAEIATDFVAGPVEWFKIHLVALIVSIIVGLPVFFKFYDLFGRALGQLNLNKPRLTIKTRVFLIGALTPLLIDTVLVQYYWARTGVFDNEVFFVWLSLELLAIAGALMFVHSFGQALQPLQSLFGEESQNDVVARELAASSTDELGVLTGRFRELFEHIEHSHKILHVGNRILRGAPDLSVKNVFENIVELSVSLLRFDLVAIMLHDKQQDKLIAVVHNEGPYLSEGYESISLGGLSVSSQAFMEGRTVCVSDANNLSEDERTLLERYEVRALICSPLLVEDETIGVIVGIHRHSVHHFSHHEIEMTEALAGEAAIVIHHQLLRDNSLYEQRQRNVADARLRSAMESVSDGIITTDRNLAVEFINPAFASWLSMPNEGYMGLPVDNLLSDAGICKPDALKHMLSQVMHLNCALTYGDTITPETGSKREKVFEAHASPISGEDNDVLGSILIFHDISELSRLTLKLAYQASHDPLTGLVNRREFETVLERQINSSRERGYVHTLCYIDLDQFKVVNDLCGHVAGDALLKQLASNMKSCVLDSDTLSRLGGDEFGLLLNHCNVKVAQQRASQILAMINRFRFTWETKTFDIGMSIGLVEISGMAGTVADVLKAADSACYLAKELGRNRIHVYRQGDALLSQRRGEMAWLQRIQRALEADRFVLYQQPIVPLNGGGGLPYCEILIRMLDENGQVIAPNTFIPVAERYQLMTHIDRWVVNNALQNLSGRQLSGDKTSSFSINLSAQSICDESFLQFVLDTIDGNNITSHSICFEVTETAAISNLQRARDFIQTLREKGCRFALDDFGSGLSSFSYLKQLPVDYIKIDGSFIKDLESDPLDRAMVEAFNDIGHLMGTKTVAEFVVSEPVHDLLMEIGVDFAQGNYIGKSIALEH